VNPLQHYPYVGPASVRIASVAQPPGAPITSREALRAWLAASPEARRDAATFVVDVEGVLRLAPRRSEHVACAGGGDVLAAGEIAFTPDAASVRWCSNQSSGYCPEPASFAALARALGAMGVAAPEGYDLACEWRRCAVCAQINLVKDAVLTCGACDAALPEVWNFAQGP
jgi:hypothetical protein